MRLGKTILAVLCGLAAVQLSAQTDAPGRRWARVRGSTLAASGVVLPDGERMPAWRVLAGAGPQRATAWIPLADASLPQQARGLHQDVLAVPAGLSSGWRIVPLPLKAWGLSSPPAEIHVVRDGTGLFRAVSTGMAQVTCGEERPAPGVGYPLLAADFSHGPFGPLHNRFGSFAGGGASIEMARHRDAAGRVTALRVIPRFSAGRGWAGIWIELADHATLADPAAGIDLSRATAIVIRGRGLRGSLGLSDPAASKRDEAVPIASLVPSPDVTTIATLRVPLLGTSLDLTHIRSLTLNLTGTGDAPLEIVEVWIVSGDADPPRAPLAEARTQSGHATGLWIWNTDEFLAEPAVWLKRFDALASAWHFTEVYLQLPDVVPSRAAGAPLAKLVYEFHRRGLTLHALDGAPWFALPEARPTILARIAAVAAFNRYWGADAAFDAIHLDVEPYLLPQFGGPRRGELLASMTSLLRAVRSVAHPLPLWVDVPFWFDETTDFAAGAKDSPCPTRRFADLLPTLVDGIVVMSYRTAPDGADGIAAHAAGEIERAGRRGRATRIALETVPLTPEDEWVVATSQEGGMVAGQPLALLPRDDDGYLILTAHADASDVEALAAIATRFRTVRVRFAPGAAPSKVTFNGRPADAIRRAAEEARHLLADGGIATGGVAYHELRTLPRP